MSRVTDQTNKRFGRLVAKAPAGKNASGKPLWLCACDCGNTAVCTSNNLQSGRSTSCGCKRTEQSLVRGKDLTGQKFNMLTARRFAGGDHVGSKARRLWECVCECGNVVEVTAALLNSLEKISCGCVTASFKHGMAKTPTYQIWAAMHDRCRNAANKSFHRYGGRGISVCERWSGRDGFENFLADMGEKPPQLSIDRKNNDGHYEPSNCRWATTVEQTTNRASTRLITFNGETLMLKEWAIRLGLAPTTLALRFKRGWSLTDALTQSNARGIKHFRHPQ